jgi:hypothetical protein
MTLALIILGMGLSRLREHAEPLIKNAAVIYLLAIALEVFFPLYFEFGDIIFPVIPAYTAMLLSLTYLSLTQDVTADTETEMEVSD